MSVFAGSLPVAGSALLLALAPAAQAQTAHASSPAIKPAAAITATPGQATRWTCVSTAMVEIAPVSFDTAGQADAWVMVHRLNGEIIAAERISGREADQLRRQPCGAPDSGHGGVALVG